MAAQAPGWQTFLGMGVVFAATLAIGLTAGWFIDSQFRTVPIFTIVGLGVGLVAAFVNSIITLRRYLRN